MRYWLDTEFNGFGGTLLSLALVAEDGRALYLVYDKAFRPEPWVKENVLPIMESVPPGYKTSMFRIKPKIGPAMIAAFLCGDKSPQIITDWPDDVRYFCEAIITGPGEMASIPQLSFHVVRVNAYPTNLEGAVQHNALWDALALKELF